MYYIFTRKTVVAYTHNMRETIFRMLVLPFNKLDSTQQILCTQLAFEDANAIQLLSLVQDIIFSRLSNALPATTVQAVGYTKLVACIYK